MPNHLDLPSRLAREHYENFPVGSRLLPARLRPHVHRIYAFARVADDIADEAQDAEALQAWREATSRALVDPDTPGTPPLLRDLTDTVRQHRLPEELLFDLLDAFARDLVQKRYADLPDLLSYCRKSADPVGRLLLHLFERVDTESLLYSDRICTALQIVNHLQDVKSDYVARDRIYLPQDRLAAHGVTETDLAAPAVSPGLRRCLAELGDFAGEGLCAGFALPPRLGGRIGLELRAILHGASLVLARLRAVDYEVFQRRPHLSRRDAPRLLLRTLFVRRPPA